MNNLHIQQYPLERLIPYARNARTHADEQISQIAGSIADNKLNEPKRSAGRI